MFFFFFLYQDQANVKMVMIQDSNLPSAHDKPLRITGETSRCAVSIFVVK